MSLSMTYGTEGVARDQITCVNHRAEFRFYLDDSGKLWEGFNSGVPIVAQWVKDPMLSL